LFLASLENGLRLRFLYKTWLEGVNGWIAKTFGCAVCIGVCAELDIVVLVVFHNLSEMLGNSRTISYHRLPICPILLHHVLVEKLSCLPDLRSSSG
jgi:hypothetical protein